MPSTHRNTKSARHLEAWEGVSPDVGVRTRRRTAKIESASSQSQSPSSEVNGESSGKENEVQGVQQNLSVRGGLPAVAMRDLNNDTNWKGDSHVKGAFGKTPAIPKQQCQSIERALTAREQNVATSAISATPIRKSAAATKFHIYEDAGDVPIATQNQVPSFKSRSSEQGVGEAKRELSDQLAVLEPSMPPEQIPTRLGEPDSCTNVSILPSHDSSSDYDSGSDHDSNSEITMTSGQEAIDQLKAINEDLKSESKYHRLMAEITMKTAAVRRGYMRSPIVPSCLSPRLYGVYEVLFSDGLQVPNSASDRAHTVADVIELHLTWEVENLKHSVNPSAAVNSFTEFAALFVPQIQNLAVAEFVGGEETDEVREKISAVVLKLMCWIMEQSVTLAEAVAPQYLSYQAVRWYDEGVRALWDLDTCAQGAFWRRLQSFPEVKMPGSYAQVPGLYSARIMDWAFTQLTWVNKMAGRLQRKVDKVPNHYGVKVELFGLTRHALKDYLRHGQHQHGISKQFLEDKGPTTMVSEKGRDGM